MICAHCKKFEHENKSEAVYRLTAKRIVRPMIRIDKKLCHDCVCTINHDYEYADDSIRAYELDTGKRVV